MTRVIAVVACGLALAACSMSMPSLDFLRPSPATEVLRIESEPPGADAQTTQGQSCRTPCELTVPAGGEFGISFALNGYQAQTVQVRSEGAAGSSEAAAGRLQPNPVYAELQPLKPPAKKRPTPRKVSKRAAAVPTTASTTAPTSEPTPTTNATYPTAYPWPDPQPR